MMMTTSSQFKVGDRVRHFTGLEGTILEIQTDVSALCNFGHGDCFCVDPRNLTLLEAVPITDPCAVCGAEASGSQIYVGSLAGKNWHICGAHSCASATELCTAISERHRLHINHSFTLGERVHLRASFTPLSEGVVQQILADGLVVGGMYFMWHEVSKMLPAPEQPEPQGNRCEVCGPGPCDPGAHGFHGGWDDPGPGDKPVAAPPKADPYLAHWYTVQHRLAAAGHAADQNIELALASAMATKDTTVDKRKPEEPTHREKLLAGLQAEHVRAANISGLLHPLDSWSSYRKLGRRMR